MTGVDPSIMAIGQAHKNYDIVERVKERIKECDKLIKEYDESYKRQCNIRGGDFSSNMCTMFADMRNDIEREKKELQKILEGKN